MVAVVEQRPIAVGVFTWPSENPRLIGSRCRTCQVVMFPSQPSCPNCTGSDTEETLLSPEGTLWSWTVQGFLPKAPYSSGETAETFTPYGVGYIELAGQCKVEARLTVADPAQLHIGMPVHLVVVPFRTEPDGTEVVTYAFAPGPGSDSDESNATDAPDHAGFGHASSHTSPATGNTSPDTGDNSHDTGHEAHTPREH